MSVDSFLQAQTRVFEYLKAGRVHPALLLGGPDRLTKFRLAKNMAKYLLCRAKEDRPYCGECSACRRVEKDLHPDVLILREEGEEILKIESIREICQQMVVGSLEGGAKICIIDECHRMNSSAANAFLKTLEEPGASRHFWLLSSQPGALPPTVLSRCLQFSLRPDAREEDDESSARFTAVYRDFLKSKAVAPLVTSFKEKEDCVAFTRFLQRRFRDAVVTPPADFPGATPFALLGAFDGAVELEGRLRSNANYGLLLESFLRKHFAVE